MTKDRDFKRLVRTRADRTGESYQAARQQLRIPEPPAGRGDDALVEEFGRSGIVRLRGVFSQEDAARMRAVTWDGWSREFGADPDDRSTWSSVPRWKTVRSAKRDPVFRAVLGQKLVDAADTLIGPGWSVSNGFGGLLASLPNAATWYLPGKEGIWHSDFGYQLPAAPVLGLRVFAVFGDVPPGGGGTLLVRGSHHLVERFVAEQPEMARRRTKEARVACHRSSDWLADLTLGDAAAPGRIERFMGQATDVGGIEVQVIEACGSPGDVYVCHPWTVHCSPPNANDQPRFLRSPTLAHRARIAAALGRRSGAAAEA